MFTVASGTALATTALTSFGGAFYDIMVILIPVVVGIGIFWLVWRKVKGGASTGKIK